MIDPQKMSEKELRALCKTNGISYYWVTGKRQSKKGVKVNNTPRKAVEREDVPLSTDEYEKFIIQLAMIDKTSALIADILWYLNERLRDSGAFVTLEQVLRVRYWEVCRDKKMLNLFRSTFGRFEMVSIELPKGIYNRILRLINDNSIFVFANRKGGPLSPKLIASHFELAGERAKLRLVCKGFTVTPRLLRSIYDPSSEGAIAYKENCNNHLHVPETQLDEFLELLEQLPKPRRNAGAKSKYGPKAHLRAIVYYIQTGCHLNEHQGSPPRRAVESQLRRWEDLGFIKKVEAFLASYAKKLQS